MEHFEKKIDMDLLETPGQFDTDSEMLEVLNKIKAAQHQLQKAVEEWQLEESKCKLAETQYGEKHRKLYLCKLSYKLTDLETCIKTENKTSHATAVQRKNLGTDTQFRERLVYTKMIATYVSW